MYACSAAVTPRNGDGLVTRFLVLIAVVALGFPLTACDVEWGGAQVALEDPAPEEEVVDMPEEEVIIPLPAGPLLYRVESADDGAATVVPVARMTDSLPADLDLPEEFDPEFRARFDSAFLAAGTELAFIADGRRVGSILLDDDRVVWNATCPSATGATTFLVTGQRLPVSGFALPLNLASTAPGASNPIEPDRRMRTYGPVLTENLLERRGYDRAYLAQRADLGTVSYGGDEGPALFATYVVNDSLTPEASDGDAVSLFFLARYEPSRGYYAVWHEYRRYRSAEDREIFTYENWIEAPPGRLDFLELYGDGSVRLAASLEREDARNRKIDWTESERCQSRQAFDGAPVIEAVAPAGAGTGQAGAPAAQTPATRTPTTQTPAGQTGGQAAAADTSQNRRRQTEPDVQPRPPVQLPDTGTAGQ